MVAEGAARYQERYCAFIDFLGFSQAVSSGVWAPDEVLAAMNKARSVIAGDTDTNATQFSDSLIISAPADGEYSFVTMITIARFLVLELTAHDVLLRGGIARGQMFHENNFAFGPAFLRAYQLEKAAVNPRIIIDRGLERGILWPSGMDKREKVEFKRDWIPVDYDGWRYVDYVSSAYISEFDAGDEGLESHYKRLRTLVQKHSASTDPSLLSKYGWLDGKLKAVGK